MAVVEHYLNGCVCVELRSGICQDKCNDLSVDNLCMCMKMVRKVSMTVKPFYVWNGKTFSL